MKKKESNIKYPPFSVAISVYKKDNPKWFKRAIDSLLNQTILPAEIILVIDGPIPNTLEEIIEFYKDRCKKMFVDLVIIPLKINKGLGNALKLAVEKSKNEWIARMDSDDISVPTRFEQQVKYIVDHPETDIIGGDITEFIDDENNIVGKRSVPTKNHEICQYMKTRCPMNHVSVMYKKKSVLNSGGYLDWFWNEDYYLWIRMLEHRCIFANTGTILVNVRVGKDMYSRRGGIKYFKSEIGLQNYMLKKSIITFPVYSLNVLKRVILQILLPNTIRGWVFRTFAREKY